MTQPHPTDELEREISLLLDTAEGELALALIMKTIHTHNRAMLEDVIGTPEVNHDEQPGGDRHWIFKLARNELRADQHQRAARW